jgi:8-amino-7-oxononanoate synthase
MPVFNRDGSEVPFDDIIAQELAALDANDQRRALRTLPQSGGAIEHEGRPLVNFSSNDYLNLANDLRVIQGAQHAVAEYGCGATASRLMAGNLAIHDELEQRLAALTGHEACLVFPSGFQRMLRLSRH